MEKQDGKRVVAHVYVRTEVYGQEKYIYVNAEQLLRGWGRFGDVPAASQPALVGNLREMEARAQAAQRGIWQGLAK